MTNSFSVGTVGTVGRDAFAFVSLFAFAFKFALAEHRSYTSPRVTAVFLLASHIQHLGKD